MGVPNHEMDVEYHDYVMEIDERTKFFVFCPTENKVLYEAFEDDEVTRIVAEGVVAGHWIIHPSYIVDLRRKDQ